MAVACWDFPGVDAAMSSLTASRCLAPQLPAYMLEFGSQRNSNPLAVRELKDRSLDAKGAELWKLK